MILSGGTAYQSDAGMCGDYDSVIGMDKTVPIERFVKKVKGERLSVAGGEGTLCAVFVETDDSTGFARRVAPVRDRKSTRLNSITNAHLVCCLLLEKKKKHKTEITDNIKMNQITFLSITTTESVY